MENEDRDSALVPPQTMGTYMAAIIGCGSIGRPLALGLAQMGIGGLILYDHDLIEHHNIDTQGWGWQDVGRPKVEVLANQCREVASSVCLWSNVVPYGSGDIQKRHLVGCAEGLISDSGGVIDRLAVFTPVDSIAVRKKIWDDFKGDYPQITIPAVRLMPKRVIGEFTLGFYGDVRTLGESIRIFAIDPSDEVAKSDYESSFFDEKDAEEGECTRRSTWYSSITAAGLMMREFARHLRGDEITLDRYINLASFDMFTDLCRKKTTTTHSQEESDQREVTSPVVTGNLQEI